MNDVQRLYPTIRPSNYQLTLTPNLKDFSFTGSEVISFEIREATTELTFHARELNITAAKLAAGEREYDVESPKLNAEEQTVTFIAKEELPAGSYQLTLEYNGPIRDDLHGWYRSRYSVDGEERWLAVTQLEAISAREVFVCIDEPAAKATFDVTLCVEPSLTALSNTEAISETMEGDVKTVTYATTPIMSTYLVAFVVGEFEHVETTNEDGVAVRVYTTPGKSHQGAFAIDTAAKILDYYRDYFDIAYPLQKLDMVALPDFAAAAMENWGLVTYRETIVLVDDDNTALMNKQLVAMVIAHELAHQWFGNLVTMGWWTDLWLNEGFASWVEYLAVDHLFPDWDMWTQFVTDEYSEARDLDALANTHPIEVPVHHPAEIDEIFDSISYRKGASMIRMLYHYLGEDDFQAGLRTYLKEHQYGNAVTADLWSALETASGKPVRTLMHAWTSQPGHPVLWFTWDDEHVKVRQERFFADPTAAADNATWPVPLQLRDAGPTELLEEATQSITDSSLPKYSKPNGAQTGFYVIGYDEAWLAALGPQLAQLAPVDRYGVLSDSFDLIKAGKLASVAGLKLISDWRDEHSLAAWNAMLEGLGGIMSIADAETAELLDQFACELAWPQVQRLGWQPAADEPHAVQLLRPRLVSLAGRYGGEALKECQKLFERIVAGEPVDADLRGAVYAIVARHGDATTYDQLVQLYEAAELQEEQRRLLRALGNFKQPELAKRSLDYAFTPAVRSQDTLSLLFAVLLNRFTTELAWQTIQDRWEELVNRYGKGGHLMSYIPDAVGAAFSTEADAARVEAFFAAHEIPGIARSIRQALERIRLKAAWADRDLAAVKAYLQDSTSR